MKVIPKLFVVALLLSLTLTIAGVSAVYDVTFEQSSLSTIETNDNNNIGDLVSVSSETENN